MDVTLYTHVMSLHGIGFGGKFVQQLRDGPGFRDGSAGGPERGGEFREVIDRHESIKLLPGEAGHDDPLYMGN